MSLFYLLNQIKKVFATEINIPEPLFGIVLTSSSFLLYWFLSKLITKSDCFFQKTKEKSGLLLYIIYQKITGLIFLGIIPFIVILIIYKDTAIYGINTENIPNILLFTAIISPLILILSFLISKSPNNYKIYPQIRIQKWNWKLVILNSSSWFLYLLGYEFLFRGVLLFSCLHVLDPIMAIVINVILYAIAHLPKGKMETIGSIPIGVILCYITFLTGSIWSAFVLHFIMATTNDYVSLYYNPEMSFK